MLGARILLVEDDEVLCGLLLRNLARRGHDVRVAEDACAALVHLRATPFDLILLDINLPDQTGWEVLRAALREGTLRPQELDGSKLPVVVLSAAQVSPRRRQEFRPLAYLSKPFPLESLLRLAAEAAQRKVGGTAPGNEDTGRSLNAWPGKEEIHA